MFFIALEFRYQMEQPIYDFKNLHMLTSVLKALHSIKLRSGSLFAAEKTPLGLIASHLAATAVCAPPNIAISVQDSS